MQRLPEHITIAVILHSVMAGLSRIMKYKIEFCSRWKRNSTTFK